MFSATRILRAVVILLCIFTPIQSFSENVLNDFDFGKKAFKKQNYQQALQFFEQAKSNGIDSISLTYNLAVTHYKLENYKQSQVYFIEIQKIPRMTNLVKYNLGLIELKLNNNKQATEFFNYVYHNTKKTKLKSLSKKQLELLGYQFKKKNKHRIKSRVAILVGHSDNVSSISTGTASGKADNFNVYAAKLEAAITNSFEQGLTARVRYYSQVYSVVKQFDYDEIEAKIAYNFINGHYRNNIALFSKQSDLSSNSYQTTIGIDAKFKGNVSRTDYFTFRARYEDISDDSKKYTYLVGTRQRYRVDYQFKNNHNINRFWYQFETNDRKDDFIKYSYSPLRHTIRYTYELKFYKHWRWRAGAEYRKSFYPDKPLIFREDDRIRYLTTLDYKFSKMWDIQGVYEYRDNQSTVDKYVYKRNVYFVNLNWRY
ncbi:MAG: hypothetical protein ACC653_06075 [Gammaproteobacteria bacterium]